MKRSHLRLCSYNDIFAKITKLFFVPNIDLFASRLNKQNDCYISWTPDPDAFAVDAFTLSWTNLSFYDFPPFSILDRVCQNNSEGQGRRDIDCTILEHSKLVSGINENVFKTTTLSDTIGKIAPASEQSASTPSVNKKTSINRLSCVRHHFEQKNCAERKVSILMKYWRNNTSKQFETYVQKWISYSESNHCDTWNPDISFVLDFLASLFDSGLGYSAINTTRLVLSTFLTIDNLPVGKHGLVKRF